MKYEWDDGCKAETHVSRVPGVGLVVYVYGLKVMCRAVYIPQISLDQEGYDKYAPLEVKKAILYRLLFDTEGSQTMSLQAARR